MPLNGAVARTMVRGVMHIVVSAGCLYFRRCVFEVAVTQEAIVKLSVEVWVMGSYLGEIRVGRTTKRLRENKVEHNVGNGGYAFCLVDGGGAQRCGICVG